MIVNAINTLLVGQSVRVAGTEEVATVIEAIGNNGYGKSIIVVQYAADSVHRSARQGFEPDQLTLVEYPQLETVIARALAAGIKITDTHVANSNTLRNAANYIALSYTGENEFMRSVVDFGYKRGYITVGQARGVLNFTVSDVRAERERANIALDAFRIDFASVGATPEAPPVLPAVQPALPNGIYTVYTPGSGHTTIRLSDTPDGWNAAHGTQVAAFLSGSDNDSDYTGFAFVTGRVFTMFKKYRVTAHKLIAALRELLASTDGGFTEGRAYALRSGHCYICNRTLTTPESITAGIGPVCAEKLGIDTRAILADATAQRERQAAAQSAVEDLF